MRVGGNCPERNERVCPERTTLVGEAWEASNGVEVVANFDERNQRMERKGPTRQLQAGYGSKTEHRRQEAKRRDHTQHRDLRELIPRGGMLSVEMKNGSLPYT